MIDIEAALSDLAEHLDHPTGDTLVTIVRERLTVAPPVVASRRSRARTLVAVAATIVVVVGAVLTIGPTRHAIADWLGIGAVEVRSHDKTTSTATGAHPVPGAPSTGTDAPNPLAGHQLTAARAAVAFTIVTPTDAAAGQLHDVEVDARVRGGLVVLRYARFTIVEIASQRTDEPVLRKLLDPGAHADSVSVGRSPGLWITGAHEIMYLGRDGNPETDTIRRSGPVLLWARGAVTYRIEGFTRLADALAVAESLP